MTWNPWKLRREPFDLESFSFPPMAIGRHTSWIGPVLGWKASHTSGMEIVCSADYLYEVEAQMEAIASAITAKIVRRTHRPAMIQLDNGSRIIGRIPQRDGKGLKGLRADVVWWGGDSEPPIELAECVRDSVAV